MPVGIGMSLDVFRSLGCSLYRYRALEISLSLYVFRLHFCLSLDVFRMCAMVVYIYIWNLCRKCIKNARGFSTYQIIYIYIMYIYSFKIIYIYRERYYSYHPATFE